MRFLKFGQHFVKNNLLGAFYQLGNYTRLFF